MTPTQKAAMEQAIKALEQCRMDEPYRSFQQESDAITALRAAFAEIAKPVAGWKLVPTHMTQAMRDVTDANGWTWPDLLAAANAITEHEYTHLTQPPAPSPSPALQAENDLLEEVNEQLREQNTLVDQACARLEAENAALQAKLDALMLEHCPGEMTQHQKDNWARHQVVAAMKGQP